MRCSSGLLLILALLALVGLLPGAASAQTTDMALGVSYSTKYGSTGRISLTAEGLGLEDMASTVYYRAGSQGEEARLSLRWAPEFQSGRMVLDATVRSQDWDHIPYQSHGARFSATREYTMSDQLTFGIGVYATQDDVTGLASSNSAVLARDFGRSSSLGAQVSVRYEIGDFEPGLAEERRLQLTANLNVAGLADRDYVAFEAGARFDQPVVRDVALTAQFHAGSVSSLEGEYVSILDRAFQGDAEPRGFAYGGLGPRDPVSGDALGGTNYYWGSVELNWQIADSPVTVGGFVDFGSTWSLPGVTDPLLMDDHSLRASAGLSVEIESAIGDVRLSFAEPFERESFDRTQNVSVALVARF